MLRSGSVALVTGLLLGASGCTTRGTPPVEDGGGLDAPIVIALDGGVDAGPSSCEPGQVDCGGTCTFVASDSLNCGSCGVVCPTGITCALGRCDCAAPMLGCDGACVDPTSDEANCGACGNACGGTEVCSEGECVPDCDAPRGICTAFGEGGKTSQICADLQTDAMHCGRCNTACAGGTSCVAGRCSCPGGQMICDRMCTDVSTSADHCGACLSSCGAGGVCASGACTSCGTGLTACGTPRRCVDTDTSRLHCGACGNACAAGEACTGGSCVCLPGLTDCGSCTNTLTDARNCGGCGIECGPGGVCTDGVCGCGPGLMMCGPSCHDLATDLAHCGACDAACPALVGGVCAGGVCGCPSGLTDCSGTCSDTTNDRENCGACGTVCRAGDYCIMSVCSDAPPIRYMQTTPPTGTVAFVDACAATGHTEVLNGADDGSTLVALPFAFRYWATNLPAGAMINIASNGWMGMDGVAGVWGGGIPDTFAPNAMIAPHSGDLVMRTPGICIATVGTAPNRQWVVEWRDSQYFLDSSPHLTFEVILTEGSGTIDFVYQTMTGARDEAMGIENQTGTAGVNACPGGTGDCTPTTGQVVRFLPVP